MKKKLLKPVVLLLFIPGLLNSCSQKSLIDIPQPQKIGKANAYAGLSQVSSNFAILEVAVGLGQVGFFRTTQKEPSGGNSLVTEVPTGNSAGVFTYISSPGAISVAARSDSYNPIIVDAENNIQYRENSGAWLFLNSNGLKFTSIATRNFRIFSNSGQIGNVFVDGRLYGIGVDQLVYEFNVNSLTWTKLGSQTAVSITVDVYGRPWILSSGGTLYSGARNGEVFTGWKPYFAPQNAYRITSNAGADTEDKLGIVVLTRLTTNRFTNVTTGGKIYWAPLDNPSNFQLLQDYTQNNNFYFTGVYCEDSGDKLWVTTSNPANYTFYGFFTGL